MVERFQVYQLTVPSVPVGGIEGVPLQLDTDAPFALRLVRSRNIGYNGWRFQTPKKAYQSNALRTDWTFPTNVPSSLTEGPYPTRGAVIYPELVYPIGSQIVCDIGNATGEVITNARLVFFGSKLFQDGALDAPTYPAKMRVLPFTYPVVLPNVAQTAILRDNQLQIRQDADFVLRYGVCDPFTLGVDGGPVGVSPVSSIEPLVNGNFTDLYVTLKDESRKAYMNAPIHINDLFGEGRPFPFDPNTFGAGATDDRVLWFPGTFYPEIYIPREHSLYFDVFRTDPTVGYFPLNLNFRFQGMKVFPAT